jgi:hypothetical protein
MLFPTRLFAAMRKGLTIDHPEPESKPTALPIPNCLEGAIDPYEEPEPTVGEWLRSLVPAKGSPLRYVRSIFLFAQWLPRYNLTWLLGDSVAGLTVGFVVIPQAMAYALLADLSPEYGLYTSFVGAALYWVFGTSKDIVIGVSLSHDTYPLSSYLTIGFARPPLSGPFLSDQSSPQSRSSDLASTATRRLPRPCPRFLG